MPIAQFNRFARVSIDIYWQFNGFARVSIDTYCLKICTLTYCLEQHNTYTVYPRLLFEWIPWMIAICTLTYFLPLFQNCRFTTIPSWQYQVLIDRFVRISIDRCCCCWTTETPLTTFFSRVSIIPIPLDLLGKELGTYPSAISPSSYVQVTISIDIQYTNLWTDQQAYSIDCCTGHNRNTSHYFFFEGIIPIPLDLLGKELGIHRQFHPPITYRLQ